MAAIKANPNTAVRRILTREGAGCDTFGMGELELAVRAGVPPEHLAEYMTEVRRLMDAYGVQAASHTFFGRDVWELGPSECAMIAGMIQLPEHYSPFRHLDKAYERRATVLETMIQAVFSSSTSSRWEWLVIPAGDSLLSPMTRPSRPWKTKRSPPTHGAKRTAKK